MKPKNSAYKIWGLTGGIASGKSTAARFFAEAGAPVVDADQVARELSRAGGAAHAAIVQRFGTADRAELRKLVFSDPASRKALEAILHPLIVQESQRQMDTLAGRGARLVIYEASLLVETGRWKDFDGLIVVDCPREMRKKRLILRDKIDEATAEQILNAQIQDNVRLAAATHVLSNTGSPSDLQKKVNEFLVAEPPVTS